MTSDVQPTAAPRPRPRRRRRLTWLWIILAVVLVVLFIAAWVGIRGYLAYQHLSSARDLVSKIQTDAIDRKDFTAASADAVLLAKDADAARSLTGDPVWGLVEKLPVVGKNLLVAREVASVLGTTADGAVQPLITLASTISPSHFKPVDGKIDLAALVKAQPYAARAATTLDQATAQASTIDATGTVGPLDDAATQLVAQLGSVTTEIDTLNGALQLLPPMLGGNGPRDYLFTFLNNAELRSKGGIVGSLALVKVDNGAFTIVGRAADAQVGPHFDTPPIPMTNEELGLYTDVVNSYIQDAASYPDWARGAKNTAAMWQKVKGGTVDGVISVDPVALSYLLKATGPITIPATTLPGTSTALIPAVTLTSDNAVSYLLHDVYIKVTDPTLEDVFFGEAVDRIFAKFASGSFDPTALLGALAQAGSEHRFNVYSTHAAEQTQLAGTTLGGDLPVSSDSTKAFGVYFDDATGAKMDYYLQTKVGAAQLMGCGSTGAPIYRVAIQVANTVKASAVDSLPDYITGGGDFGVSSGTTLTDVYVVAPPSVNVSGGWFARPDGTGDPLILQSATDDGRSIGKFRVQLDPGDVRTITMDFVGRTPFTGKVTADTTPQVNPVAPLTVIGTCTVGTENATVPTIGPSTSVTVPDGQVVVSTPVVPNGGSTVVAFGKGYFTAGEKVQVTLQGTGQLPTISTVAASAVPTTPAGSPTPPQAVLVERADADGGVQLLATFAKGVTGDYSLIAAGATSGKVGTASFSVGIGEGGGSSAGTSRVTIVVLVVVLAILVIGGAIWLWRWLRARRRRQR